MGMQNHWLSLTYTQEPTILRNPLLVPTLYCGTHILPQFSSGYLKKRCVHIIAKVMLYSGTVPWQQALTLPK